MKKFLFAAFTLIIASSFFASSTGIDFNLINQSIAALDGDNSPN